MPSLRSILRRSALSAALFLAALSGAQAAAGDEGFYKGRTVTILVGFSAGGGFDIYARLLAQHLGDYLPGHPHVVVQNMPGAGSLTAALDILNVAPADGTTIGIFGRTVPFAPLLSDSKFDGTRFKWVGSVTKDVSVCIGSALSDVKNWNDMLTKTFVAGGEGHDSDLDINANLLKNVFGAKIKLVTGYPGTNDIKVAMDRREVDGVCGLSYSTLQSSYASQIKDGSINILVQVSLTKNPDLPNVPFVGDFATPEQRDVLRLLLEPQAMARPFAAPPGIAEERLSTLRTAFDNTMKDPNFLAEAARANLDVHPMQGADMEKMVAGLYRIPKEISEKSKLAIADQ
jgi:tripartite-type tricarboxylate transporter receptor subunit TctC